MVSSMAAAVTYTFCLDRYFCRVARSCSAPRAFSRLLRGQRKVRGESVWGARGVEWGGGRGGHAAVALGIEQARVVRASAKVH